MEETPSGENNYGHSEIEYEEYFLIKENIVYKIIVKKFCEEIKIKCKKYEINFTLGDLSILTKIKFETINKAYRFIVNLFEDNKVFIKNIIINKEIKLILKMENNNNFEMILSYNERKKRFYYK